MCVGLVDYQLSGASEVTTKLMSLIGVQTRTKLIVSSGVTAQFQYKGVYLLLKRGEIMPQLA